MISELFRAKFINIGLSLGIAPPAYKYVADVPCSHPFPPSSSVMSLKDLEGHIKVQEDAIGKLPAWGINSEPDAHDDWEELRVSVWGKGLETLQEERTVVRGGSVTEKYVVGKLPCDVWPSTPEILVRSEYEKVEREAVLSSQRYNMFVISGQPGIGLFPSFFTASRI